MGNEDDPPVVQDNPGTVQPFEVLVRVLGRPAYDELDPTFILFATFPMFFGLMIGDLGYGLFYVLMGYWVFERFESEALRGLGAIGIACGLSTMLFGVLYGEVFGLHVLGEVLFGGSPPFHKGIQPAFLDFALLWLTVSILLGLLHLTVGYLFEFYESMRHGLGHAIEEAGSWLFLLIGIWTALFSKLVEGLVPGFMVGPESAFAGHPVPLGFTGFPAEVGLAGLALAGVGLAILLYEAGGIALIEWLDVLVNTLSYTRLAAVLLAKAGMAFAVNLIVFGIYEEEAHGGTEFLFITTHGGIGNVPADHVVFPGLFNLGDGAVLAVGLIVGVLVFLLGHALVFALGVTSAGLEADRLEYVEFFQKFYDGGGDPYEPFGYVRRFTTED
jgi:V/A-type H+-transporting ATPase subunit I